MKFILCIVFAAAMASCPDQQPFKHAHSYYKRPAPTPTPGPDNPLKVYKNFVN